MQKPKDYEYLLSIKDQDLSEFMFHLVAKALKYQEYENQLKQ